VTRKEVTINLPSWVKRKKRTPQRKEKCVYEGSARDDTTPRKLCTESSGNKETVTGKPYRLWGIEQTKFDWRGAV